MGKATPSATRKIFASSPIPNHRMTSGTSARWGIVRIICTDVSRSLEASGNNPLTSPSTNPIEPPMKNPTKARFVLTQMYSYKLPSAAIRSVP